ncbi:DNA internalization-related competence protein ComEC/Rec2 [Priestia megaterium]|uniref:DNA internalization-related competence protein ComEC/Rec2 n=1 Tax=Priestia megaterium TaxID=1404 RepID=UPI0026E44683|nr:DNA internalization-related competence protein ComEC/Rec2 [Priestia megaterium]MDO6847023.1 DNA internalization-related competence protein ComEC/Rec2 [Priestia megaterium]
MKGYYIYCAFSMMIALYVYDNHSAVSLFLLIVLFIFQWLQCPRKVVIASALLSVLCVYLLAETNKHNKTILLAESSSFTGEISSVPHSDGDKLTFKFTVQNEEVMAFYKLKTLEEKQQLEKLTIHQVCQLAGQLTSPSPARNLHSFDYQQYLYHQSIHWQLNVKRLDLGKCQLPTLTPLTYLTFIRQKGINYIQQTMSDPGAGFMQALIYGERTGIKEESINRYQQFGLIHLLAISGLHVGLLTAMCFYLLIRIGITRERAITLLLLLLPVYMILAGGSASVVRAVFMSMLMLISIKIQRKILLVDSISLAFIAMLLFKPYYLFDVGFQLSFAVSFALILSSQTILPRFHSSFSQLMAVSAIAQVSSLPLLLYYFYGVSLLSLPLNMVFVPLFSLVVLPLCLLILFVRILVPGVSELLEQILHVLLLFCEKLLGFFEWIPADFVTGKPHIMLFLGMYLCIYALFVAVEQGEFFVRYMFLLVALLAAQCMYPYLNPKGTVTMVDVGQGDCFIIELPYRKGVYMIDTGGTVSFPKEPWQKRRSSFDVGEDVLVPFLHSKGMTRVDKMIITHGDYDHAGAAQHLFSQVAVGELVLGEKAELNEVEAGLVIAAQKQSIPVQIVQQGDSWQEGGVLFQIISPTGFEETSNNGSIVIDAKLGNLRWLFTGDLEREGEQRILKDFPNLKADVLKVGHHGSKTSTSEEFVQHLNPKVALVSAGQKNRYGHPHQEILELLKSYGVYIYRTDEDGGVMYEFTKKSGTFSQQLP